MENILMEYIVEEGLVMIPTLWFLGYIISETKKLSNIYIPFILLIISFAITPFLMGGYNADTIIQSILVTAGAVLTHEGIKNGVKILKGE